MMTCSTTRSRRHAPASVTATAAALLALGGCAMPSAGPTTSRVVKAAIAPADSQLGRIRVIDVTDQVIRQVALGQQRSLFSEQFGDVAPRGTLLGRGDTVDISVWEAPPAVLFGTGASFGSIGQSARNGASFEQMIDTNGRVSVPFAGSVQAEGRSPTEIATEIQRRLNGRAHLPQVVVRRLDNATSAVTVVGDVAQSRRVPLGPKGERLLDVVASAGGTKQPVNKVMVQINRGDTAATMPLEAIIRDPRQNIRMAADDIVTLSFQPYSFIALGAVGHNAEVPFEATGLTLAQALGRIGGLQDQRSDPKGVFVFRMESPEAIGESAGAVPDSAVPVVYRFDMTNPVSLFLAQSFAVRNRDVVYVSNSPTADMQKFLGLLSSAAFSLTGIANVVP
jgi:polysaccharide export outer membrane protein